MPSRADGIGVRPLAFSLYHWARLIPQIAHGELVANGVKGAMMPTDGLVPVFAESATCAWRAAGCGVCVGIEEFESDTASLLPTVLEERVATMGAQGSPQQQQKRASFAVDHGNALANGMRIEMTDQFGRISRDFRGGHDADYASAGKRLRVIIAWLARY